MYHSITFTAGSLRKNTWSDWHLIPVTRPVFAQPNPVYNYVEVPGADGSLDLTDYLVGRPTYSDRQGTFEFYVVNESSSGQSYGNYADRKAEIAAFFDGRKMNAYPEDEGGRYYEGRFFFKGWTPDASHSKVTIEYRVKPYWHKNLPGGQEAGL